MGRQRCLGAFQGSSARRRDQKKKLFQSLGELVSQFQPMLGALRWRCWIDRAEVDSGHGLTRKVVSDLLQVERERHEAAMVVAHRAHRP